MSFKSAVTTKNDFLTDVSRGKVGDFSAFVVEGHNIDFDTADGEMDLWGCGVNLTYLGAAETLDVASDDAADTNGGTGAWAVFILGVDAAFNVVQDLVTLNGTTPVESAVAFYRVNGIFLVGSGTSETNEGNITLTASSSSTIQGCIDIGYSTGIQGFHTIPIGKKSIIKQVEFDSTRVGGGQSPDVNFRVYIRASGPNQPWFVVLERKLDTSVANQIIIPYPLSNRIVAGADIRFTASTTQNGTDARTRVTLMDWDD